jgi:hypothetical protein
LAKDLAVFSNLEKISLQHLNIRACTRLDINVSPGMERSERMKKEINDTKEFLMRVFKRWKNTNIILFFSQGS